MESKFALGVCLFFCVQVGVDLKLNLEVSFERIIAVVCY